jgi:hypothetical protein
MQISQVGVKKIILAAARCFAPLTHTMHIPLVRLDVQPHQRRAECARLSCGELKGAALSVSKGGGGGGVPP